MRTINDEPKSLISLALEDLNLEIFDAIPYGLAVYSVVDDGDDFIIEAMNPAALTLSEADIELALGHSVIDVFPGVREMGFLDALRRVYASGEDEDLPPMRYRDAVRGERWFNNHLVLITPKQIMAIYQDVSAQIQTQRALDIAQERYTLLTEAMTDGIYDWNIADGELYLSPRWKSQIGFSENALDNHFSTWADLLHPSQREAVLQDLQDCLAGEHTLWEREFQLRQADGGYRWIRSRGTIVRDTAGSATRVIGVHIDIDESRRITAEADRQIRLAEAVFEAVPDIFMLIDAEDRIIDYRTQQPDLLYRPPEEFINRRVGDVMPEAVFQQYKAAKATAVAEGRMVTYTFPLATGGQERHFEVRLRALQDSEGFSVVTRDITEAKQLEEAQKERTKELAGLYFIQKASQLAGGVSEFANVVVSEVVKAMQCPDKVRATLTIDEELFQSGCVVAPGEHVAKTVDDGKSYRGEIQVEFDVTTPPLKEELDFMGGVAQAVSLWLRTESARHQSEIYSRIVANTQDQMALLDTRGRYRVVNEAYASRVGLSPESMEGIAAAKTLGESHWQEELQKHFEAALKGEVRNFQEWRDTPAGRRFFNVIYSPLREQTEVTGVVVSAHDITELDEARMQLRRAARVFSDSSDAVIFIRVDGVIEDANAALAAISGHDIGSIKGKSAALLLSSRNPEDRWTEVLAALKNQQHWKGEVWLQHSDGHDIPGLMTVSAVPGESGSAGGEDGGYTAVFTDISDLKVNEENLRHLANNDVLTGLPNRHQVMNIIERNVELSRRNRNAFTVMFIDLDHFKDVNDTLGHSAGDKLLQQAAARLRSVLRANDVLARVGGDEFVAVFPGLDNGSNVSIIADKVIAAMSQPFELDANTARVTASVGIASYPEDGEDRETLLRNADTAMYQAKSDGRSTWRCYSDEMTRRAARHLFLVSGLRQALANGDLRMVYQPEYDLQSGDVTGFEALLRWDHPDVGEIAPKEFIAAAEESSLIQALDLWAIDRVCSDIHTHWRDAQPATRFAINISGMTLSMDKFVEKLGESLQRHDVRGDVIELEVSEYTLLHEMDSGRLSLDALRDLGVSLVIDDFGTGYSNLLYLRRLPIRQLKIDGSFVRELPSDPDGATITNAIIALGRSLQLDVVAAGVETEEQASCLRQHIGIRCQGYLYSKPVEAERMTEFLD